ncbi:DNA integrity scanning protein DisA nucleotide-binding domain protein [Spiroplasma endosymbiont of Lasioglossum malachurum]|uniref:diadenylate cyclase n=1 Tax=Spiroplasma endosymbiont of Lasioglossum malachurum TaxID=3066319 RepID=UPI0030CB858A
MSVLPLNIISTVISADIGTVIAEIAVLFGITISLLMTILILIVMNTFIRGKKVWWTTRNKSHMKLLATSEKRMLASVLAEAVIKLAEEKIGALITIERNVSLNEYTDLGVKIDSEVTSQLLQSIFIKGSPLHDGAVIIRLGRIECASTYFPLTNKKISSQFGSRHRAAIGISEQTDAVSVIVSETNGSVSIARSGKFLQVENLNNLVRTLYDELASTKEMVQQV